MLNGLHQRQPHIPLQRRRQLKSYLMQVDRIPKLDGSETLVRVLFPLVFLSYRTCRNCYRKMLQRLHLLHPGLPLLVLLEAWLSLWHYHWSLWCKISRTKYDDMIRRLCLIAQRLRLHIKSASVGRLTSTDSSITRPGTESNEVAQSRGVALSLDCSIHFSCVSVLGKYHRHCFFENNGMRLLPLFCFPRWQLQRQLNSYHFQSHSLPKVDGSATFVRVLFLRKHHVMVRKPRPMAPHHRQDIASLCTSLLYAAMFQKINVI